MCIAACKNVPDNITIFWNLSLNCEIPNELKVFFEFDALFFSP